MTDSSAEAVARVLSRHMHDSRERAWDDGLVTDGQKAEAIAAAEAAIAAYRAALPSPEREPMREALEPFAAMAEFLDDTNERRDAIYCGGSPGLRCQVTQADYHRAKRALAPPTAQSGDRT